MDIALINNILAKGNLKLKQCSPLFFPLKKSPFIFEIDFGLDTLPEEPGILLIRGPRQYGKSTWFAKQFRKEKLKVINQLEYETNNLQGFSLENFLLEINPYKDKKKA